MDFDYWGQIETLPSNSFYTTTTTKPQTQKTTFIVHSNNCVNENESNSYFNNSNEYLELTENDLTLKTINSNFIKQNKNFQQQRPLIVLLPSQRSENFISSSNISKTIKTTNIESLSSPIVQMPLLFSSNDNNDDTNIYSTTTLTPVYRIRNDSLLNNSESFKNQKFIQKSSQNIIQHQQFNDSSPSTSSSNLEGAAVCAVCGDGHAKLHYGVLACYGCKGFFRRTLTGNYRYICRFGNKCIVNKFQRNSCRCCRFNRCIEVGMDPKAVRPDRDLTGKQRVPRIRKRPIGEELIGHMMRLHKCDDWTRKLPAESRLLLMQLMNIELNVTKGDENNDTCNTSNSHLTNSSNDIQNNNDNPLINVSLKELFENKLLNTKRTEMCYEPYRMAKPEELSKIAHRGAIASVDWVESLMELVIDSIKINTSDKISMVKNCYAPLTIFNFSARTAQKTKNPDILCLCSFSYVPRRLPSEFNGSNHLSNNLIDRTLNELVAPLRKLSLKEEEVVALKATIILDPNAKNLSEEAQHAISALRNAVQDMLFHSVKELHPSQNAASRFGNLLLLLPTITTLSGLMSENMQFCQVFGWTDPLLNELFNNDDEEKTVSYNQENGGPLSAFLADEDEFDVLGSSEITTSDGPPPVSYSPPMLGGEPSSHGNYSEICHNNYEQPSPPGVFQQVSCSSSSSNSSPSPFNSSSLSCVCIAEKCEMSTQTDIIMNFDSNISTNFNNSMDCSNQSTYNSLDYDIGYNDNGIFFGGEQVNFNDLSVNGHSSFQDLFYNKDSTNLINNNILQNQNNNEEFPNSSDFLLFDENGETLIKSNIIDLNGLMQ